MKLREWQVIDQAERHGSSPVKIGPLDSQARIDRLLPLGAERRIRAAEVTEIRMQGFSLEAVGRHVDLTRERVRQLDNIGRRVLTYTAMGVLASIERSRR